MINIDFRFILHCLVGVIFLVQMLVTVRRMGFSEPISRSLIIFGVISILLEISLVFAGTWNSDFYAELLWARTPILALMLSALVGYYLTVSYLHRNSPSALGWMIAAVLVVASILLELNVFGLANPLFTQGSRVLTLQGASLGILIAGWGILTVLMMLYVIRLYRNTERVSSRNRIAYWAFGMVLTLVGDILILVSIDYVGSLLRLLGVATISYILLTHRLPDLRITLRRFLSALIVGLLELIIYTLGFYSIQYFFQDFAGYDPLFAGMVLALLLLILFNPLLRLIQQAVSRLIMGKVHDPTRVLREYSQSVSNVLNLDLLATVAIGLISEVFEVENGALFTVDSEIDPHKTKHYRLKGVQGMGKEIPIPGLIPADSPIAEAFAVERRILTQSEIDMLPKYRRLTGAELSWLSHQDFDVYVPIHTKEEWAGILALGPKKSGASYHEADFEFLATLADQTAVALQNARLVESLVRINNEFRRAYARMEEAHTKLERIDRTKSDFISIASHELRTPLTVLSGYSQMLLDDPSFGENVYYNKILTGIHDGTSRLHEIVDSMLEVAKIDTRALELKSEPIHINSLLDYVCRRFTKALEERDLVLTVEPSDELPELFGDVEALQKVFYHLVINAIKYTPDGGSITISSSILEEGNARFPLGGVEVIVSDTGIGIDPRFKDLIFTKFYQTGELALHSSGKTKFKGGGPGLGLAIVRGIVQAHGGRVWAESPGYDEEVNPGSKFHVILPTAREKVVQPV